jgi:polyhydroxybutyrate depolymerase
MQIRSVGSRRGKVAGSKANRSVRRSSPRVEALEGRVVLSFGGVTNAGLLGQYFANTSLSGTPVFSRQDVTTSDDGVRLSIKPADSTNWTLTKRSVSRAPLITGLLSAALPGLTSTESAVAQSSYDDAEYFLTYGGLQRRYLVHTPPGYDGSTQLPVVIGFHGQGPGAESFRLQSGFNNVADQNDFIVVYPDGTGPTNRHSWNAGPGSHNYASSNNIDDVGFVRAMLDTLSATYAVDTNRIYATGMSNGASMCDRLGIEMSDRIAAIGTVSGLLAIKESPPPRPVPVIHFHGMQDPLVPYSWVAYTTNWWKRADHCLSKPVSVDVESDQTEYDYAPATGKAGSPVVLFALPEGGHTWPGGVDVTAGKGTGNLVTTVPASQLIWHFCQNFSISTSSIPTHPTSVVNNPG